MLVAAALALTGCSHDAGGTGASPSDARKTIVRVVEESTAAVGGEWTLYRDPTAEVCSRTNGRERAQYVYILERAEDTDAVPAADVRTAERLWKGKGITTERFRSGGTDPLVGITGRGGPVTSIGLDAYPQGYTMTGVSRCFDGDVAELRRAD